MVFCNSCELPFSFVDYKIFLTHICTNSVSLEQMLLYTRPPSIAFCKKSPSLIPSNLHVIPSFITYMMSLTFSWCQQKKQPHSIIQMVQHTFSLYIGNRTFFALLLRIYVCTLMFIENIFSGSQTIKKMF